MKLREVLTACLDATPARPKGSLAVAQGPVVSVYGLDLVEAWPATYVIHSVGVARVDKVVAGAGEHHVVTFTKDDLVVAAAALDPIVPAATVDLVTGWVAFQVVSDGGADNVLDKRAGYGEATIRSGRTEFRSLTPQLNAYPVAAREGGG